MKTLLKNVYLRGKIIDVLIEGNRFKKIAENITEETDKIINGEGKAIEPAFYNCHTHIPMTILKGLGDDKELHDWLIHDIWPREAKMTPDDIYIASKFAILEMIKGGTVFCNDMYQYGEQTMKAIDEMGIRGVVSKPEIDIPTPELLEKKKKIVLDFIDYKNINENRIIKGISCHAVYTVSDDFLQFYSDLAKKYSMPIHIHACETKFEVENCLKKKGCTPIEHLEKLGLLTDKTILAHCVHLSDKDIEIIKKHNTKVAHCPISNFKLKSGLMAFQKLTDAGVLITLGTDGSASNNSLGMLEEMKACALNAKTQANSSKAGNVNDVYKTATVNGAKAFGIDAGVIEEGKIADFLLYDLNHYLLLPNFNLISNIVYSAQNECITDVFCDGKQLMCNRKVENEEKIIEDFIKLSEKYKNLY
jgi:5-methylthioadenosine/S-adenosylhomocysteine deaminase